jgi:hypothetical protein
MSPKAFQYSIQYVFPFPIYSLDFFIHQLQQKGELIVSINARSDRRRQRNRTGNVIKIRIFQKIFYSCFIGNV